MNRVRSVEFATSSQHLMDLAAHPSKDEIFVRIGYSGRVREVTHR
jgi:hypothetical protein